jgi:hypothetical protein
MSIGTELPVFRRNAFIVSEVGVSSETLISVCHIRHCHTAEGHNLRTFESGYFGHRVVCGRILSNWDFETYVRKTSPELK